jgi:hypothetical protein
MTRKLDIEARLERSLVNQVKAPQLGKKFDASVWARIEAETQAATNPVLAQPKQSTSARWLLISNAIGVSVAVALVVVFGLQSFADVSLSVPTVEVSAATREQIYEYARLAITFASLAFGLFFTPIGRRLRNEFS